MARVQKMGNSQAKILGKVFFFFAFLLILGNGCVEEFKEGYKEGIGEDLAEEEETTMDELPEEEAAEDYELKEYIDMQNGYSIKAPPDWSVKIENNKYLVASSPEGSLGVIIWPAVLEGKYKEMTIRDFTNYLVGLIVKQYPDFKREKMYEGPRKDSMEIVGTFSYNGVLKRINLFAYLENGYGMVSGYEAPVDVFKEKEPVLREILSSYNNIQSAIEKATPINQGLKLEEWSDGVITVQVPTGWQTISGGNCETKYFISKDPANPINQVFYFSELGPIYISQEKKEFDQWYVASGGYNIQWLDAPVIQPLTPENFLTHIKEVTEMELAKKLNPNIPKLENVNILSEKASNLFLGYDGQQKIFTAEFEEDGIKGKGQFLVVTAEFPQVDLGYAMMVVGVRSSPEEFDSVRESLIKSLESFTMDSSYISSCIAAQNQAMAATLKAGKTLSETSDIIMDAYEYRQQTMDKINEQWSDAILGRERLYDPGTETVYSVPNSFKDYYNTNRDSFEMNSLQEVPPNKWSEIPLDGEAGIR